jgi:hypothetical protein
MCTTLDVAVLGLYVGSFGQSISWPSNPPKKQRCI